MHWPSDAVVSEAALPIGVFAPTSPTHLHTLLENLGEPPHLQMLPQAGIITWAWPSSTVNKTLGDEPLESVSAAQSKLDVIGPLLHGLGGQLQIQQVPLGWTSLYTEWNGYSEPSHLTLAQRLLDSMNPTRTVFTPKRPEVVMLQGNTL